MRRLPAWAPPLVGVRMATPPAGGGWRPLRIPDGHLRLDVTLPIGQAYRWRRTPAAIPWTPPPPPPPPSPSPPPPPPPPPPPRLPPSSLPVTPPPPRGRRPSAAAAAAPPAPPALYEEWAGAIEARLFVLRQLAQPPQAVRVGHRDPPVYYRLAASLPPAADARGAADAAATAATTAAAADADADADAAIHDYFHASVDAGALLCRFAAADGRFAALLAAAPALRGLRTLRTPPTEALYSFLCTPQCQLARSATLAQHLGRAYGTRLGAVDGWDHYAFPGTDALAAALDEGALRAAGFGYRARTLPAAAAAAAAAGGDAWLAALRGSDRGAIAGALTALPGVGQKVAACVASLALDADAIPVDTHVWTFMARDYMPHLAGGG
ncbi:LOW QUALITY PROTEIN: hypothetical protein BU14_0112s0025 [Porphyra umbilicalis]|uniref:DNA-(apurinic or apyrimidinic site) lyase n=1 Tax=Porphyra umbilicalis TaxID=2786 RepID=A0A1X6PC57_PORUM|nr:LOW QUALITY PROTEIN: hypothetical protein BU14_0112s0025 [Porphyra umbilicalis]|eukprot:OSX78326.1 LOW QUALITY PROTEIN: hypothetical protein BU14_0112s0025 [Porphyra umbilicalis]